MTPANQNQKLKPNVAHAHLAEMQHIYTKLRKVLWSMSPMQLWDLYRSVQRERQSCEPSARPVAIIHDMEEFLRD